MSRATRILITGGGGFLGTSVGRRILQRSPAEVTVVDPRVPSQLVSEFGDRVVHDSRDLAGFLAGPPGGPYDCIVHLAWSSHPATSMAFPREDLAANLGTGIQLLEKCKALGVRRLVFASSGGTVYGELTSDRASEEHPTNPLSIYGAAKLSFEHYAQVIGRRDGFDVVSLRVTNPYGGYQLKGVAVGSIANFLLAARDKREIVLFGDGSIVRDYVSIEDVAGAFHLAIVVPSLKAGPYNVGTGVGNSLNDIVALVERVSGRSLSVNRQPQRGFDVPRNVLDCQRFQDATGWMPLTSLEVGVGAMWNSLVESCRKPG